MYKLILSLIFITLISMTYGQAIQTGTYTYMSQVSYGNCVTKMSTGSTLTQNANGYQLYNSKMEPRLVNITVNSDNTLQGFAPVYYSGGGLLGYARVKGIAYNQYSFQAVVLPTPGNGGSFIYTFASCPSSSSRLGEIEQNPFEITHDLE